jgi:hypothetical protein
MAWGFNSSSYRAPAPQRLTLEELLAQQRQFQPAPRPKEIQDLGGLGDAERRRLQMQSVFAGMGSLGAAMSTGDWRYAGQGAGDVAAMQEQALAQANARQEQEWQTEQERRAAEYQQQEKQTQMAAVHGMYQRVIEGEAPDSPFVARAEAAARAGNMSELATMASPEVKGKRAGARAKGYDPDAWDTNERLTKELAAELDRQRAAQAEAAELARLEKEEAIRRAAKVEEEKALRALGPEPQWLPPLSRLEAEEQVRAKYRAQSEAATQRIMEANGVPGLAKLDPATNALSFTPATGIPEKPGRIQVFTNEDGVQAPYQLADDGNWYPMKVSQRSRSDAGGAGSGGGGTVSPPQPGKNGQALYLRDEAARGLLQGRSEQEALGMLRLEGGKDGYTPEQILQHAKAQARKRGWKG